MTTTERLRELLAAATPGPWKHGPLFWEAWSTSSEGGVRVFEVPHVYPNGAHQPGVYVDPDIGRSREPDAALIVEAVNSLPKLLAVVEAAREYSPRFDHDWRCEIRTHEVGWKPFDPPVINCECGFEELRAAIAALDEP